MPLLPSPESRFQLFPLACCIIGIGIPFIPIIPGIMPGLIPIIPGAIIPGKGGTTPRPGNPAIIPKSGGCTAGTAGVPPLSLRIWSGSAWRKRGSGCGKGSDCIG